MSCQRNFNKDLVRACLKIPCSVITMPLSGECSEGLPDKPGYRQIMTLSKLPMELILKGRLELDAYLWSDTGNLISLRYLCSSTKVVKLDFLHIFIHT